MSITFYASQHDKERGYHMPLFSCDCSQRWIADCDAFDAEPVASREWPLPYSCEHCRAEVNLANVNALELLSWLDVEVDYAGTIEARELAAKCRRRLWDEQRNHDAGIEGYVEKIKDHATLINPGRRPGYLREQTERILAIAEKAGDHSVSWS